MAWSPVCRTAASTCAIWANCKRRRCIGRGWSGTTVSVCSMAVRQHAFGRSATPPSSSKQISKPYAKGNDMKLKMLTKYLQQAGLLLGASVYSQYTYDADLLLKAAAAVGATADGTLILD